MSALLRQTKQISIFCLLTCVALSTATSAYAQSEVKRPTGSASAENETEEKELPPADISDLGTVTIDGLKDKPIYWLCRNREVVRTLRVEPVSGGCNTIYTKDGLDRVVSQAMGVYSCLNVFGNIRRNLQAASWKCKDISNTRVSSSP